MSLSYAALNPANVELSPVRITYKGVDLGGTLGNCALSIETMKADIKMDQMGETVIDRHISGHKFSVTTELAEVKFMDNWKVVFPQLHLVTSGGNKLGYFDSQIGDSDSSKAGLLVLHPMSLPDSDKSQDYNFYMAVADAKSEVVYGPAAQVKLKLVFNILPDFGTIPPRFMSHGDPAIGLVAAVAGSPVFSGTGNGTMTSVAAFSGVTKTETITAKVVTPLTNSGVFEVHGSVSGPLGLATVGTPFVSPVVAFTINDGATDFVLNDQFTIAMTAANYA